MITKEYLPTQRSKHRCFFLIGVMIFLYIIDNSPAKALVNIRIYNNLIKPLLWIGLAYVAWSFPVVRSKAGLKHKNLINLWAFNFAVIFIILSAMAGFIDGFGKSPYSQTPKGIAMNIIFVGSVLVAGELVRNSLISNLTKEENYIVFILVTLLMTVTNISFSRFLGLKEVSDIVKFIAEFFAPEFAHHLLATYLAFLGGPIASMIYLAAIQAFHWLSPILPNLKWITKALIGVLCPIFSLMAIQGMYLKASKQLKRHEKDDEGLLGWMITSIVSIAIIWFSVGVFPIYPSVIATGSMEPMIKAGDVILVEKVRNMEDIHSLQVEDVIQFKRDTILISHRIIEIVEDENQQKSYRTKGDNNSAIDTDLVEPQQIKGKIVYVVPKIGWPSLLMRSKEQVPIEEIIY
ncbi:signal peptidase, endoplasmic reticulum-type [Natronincola peptidivorans]|uniref:Signal peptidase I n=1 Tax=Natronincola peptidivorans TaxID=426128 RepID=A0A1H9ZYY9_9FIRM|nr:signal peptidase I [Natronincola peptidivorans]SES87047.1 signal peptidase, endoplasmic reticulum-type [Natronincola peptidivorans]